MTRTTAITTMAAALRDTIFPDAATEATAAYDALVAAGFTITHDGRPAADAHLAEHARLSRGPAPDES